MSDVGLPYDYESIMHYSSNSFARNPNRPTISAKSEGIKLGQRKGLSKVYPSFHFNRSLVKL